MLTVTLLIFWFSLVLFPFFAFRLAQQGQMQVRDTRIFLVQDSDNSGVGFHTTKPARDPAGCETNRIHYLLWEGEPDNSFSCYCVDGVAREPVGRTCE